MQTILEKLYQANTLTQLESQMLFQAIIQGDIEQNQLAAALISMKVRGETSDEITGAAKAFLANAKMFPTPDYQFADIVGTGGDGTNSINISTASAFVASCCGKKIAKHGNRSVSSKTGSSDLLSAFNIKLDISAQQARQSLDQLGICFLFAPHYHQGFQHAAPVRQQLKTRTLFNVLGPLINPAHPPLALIGVYSANLLQPIAASLKALGYQRAAVVYGDGMDEVAIHGVTQVAELRDGDIHYYQLTAQDFGLASYPLSALQGGDPAENKALLTDVLQGHGKPAHEAAIAANVALVLRLFGDENLKDNAQYAIDIMRSGKPYQQLQALAAQG